MVNVSETGFMIAIWRFLGLLVWTPLRSYVGHTYDTPERPLAPRRSHRRASRGAQVKHLIQRGLKRLRSPDPSEGFFEELAPAERALRYRTPPELGAEIEARIQDSSPSRPDGRRQVSSRALRSKAQGRNGHELGGPPPEAGIGRDIH
jgi:hypothetical protein